MLWTGRFHPLRAGAILLSVVLCTPGARAAPKRLAVLTTTTDLASIVRTVGGEEVHVTSLCRGPEDPHFLDARPSFIRLANRADLVVANGMELEVGYLPLILRESANPSVRPGAAGFLDASAHVRKLEVPAGGSVSRALGDVHPYGNPHYLKDPANAVLVAQDIARALSALRPAETAAFAARLKAFRVSVTELLLGKPDPGDRSGKRKGGVLARFRPYKGVSIVAYHADMIYLSHRLGLTVLGTLEPKPGVPPTARHMRAIQERAKAAGVKAVLYEVFQPRAPVQAFSKATGAHAVLIAHQPGAVGGTADLLAMYRKNAAALLVALESGKKR